MFDYTSRDNDVVEVQRFLAFPFRYLRKSRRRRRRNLRGYKRTQTQVGHSESESDKLVRNQLYR